MKILLFLLSFSLFTLSARPLLAAPMHETPCNHVCTSPSCVAAAITSWEGANSAGCANVDMNSATATPTYVTECTRLDMIDLKRGARTVLTCSSGSCSITGTFRCPSATGYKITQSFSQACPQRGSGVPDAYITNIQYGYGVGTYAECRYPDGAFLLIRCNEQAGSTSVFVATGGGF